LLNCRRAKIIDREAGFFFLISQSQARRFPLAKKEKKSFWPERCALSWKQPLLALGRSARMQLSVRSVGVQEGSS
jgi:hypothetical protein